MKGLRVCSRKAALPRGIRLRHGAGVFWRWEERIAGAGEAASREGTPKPPAWCFGAPELPPRPARGWGTGRRGWVGGGAGGRHPRSLPARDLPGSHPCLRGGQARRWVAQSKYSRPLLFARIIFTPGWRRLGSAGAAALTAFLPLLFLGAGCANAASTPAPHGAPHLFPHHPPPACGTEIPAAAVPLQGHGPQAVPGRVPNLTGVRLRRLRRLRWAGCTGREGNGIGLT